VLYREELEAYILERLSAAANRDDIVRYVCERGRIEWVEGKALVADVEDAHAAEIARKHAPINLTSAAMAGLFGTLVTGYATLSIFEPLLGRPLPNVFYLLNDFAVHYGLIPDTRSAVDALHRFGLLPDFWRTLYTLGQTYGVSADVINAAYVLASGYFYWPLLLLGICSLIVGSLEFFKTIFRFAGR
jgi:hypothetical protein